MTDAIVARRYAGAIFALGKEQGDEALSRYGSDLAALVIIRHNRHVRRIYLIEKSLFFAVGKLVVIAKKLFLSVLFKLCFCF